MFFSKQIIVIAIFLCTTYGQPKFNQTNPIASSNIDKQRQRIMKSVDMNDYKYFENIVEEGSTSAATSFAAEDAEEPHEQRISDVDKYSEIKGLLGQLLQKIREVEKGKRMEPRESILQTLPRVNVTRAPEPSSSPNHVAVSSVAIKQSKLKKEDAAGVSSSNGKQRWGHWTDWSSCSVSCGKGREIRWRHCLQNCQEAETEMEEKICQLPACSPGKLFGITF